MSFLMIPTDKNLTFFAENNYRTGCNTDYVLWMAPNFKEPTFRHRKQSDTTEEYGMLAVG